MNESLPPRKYSAEEQEDIRSRVKLARAEDQITNETLAKEADLKPGTMTVWLGGKYEAEGSNIAAKMEDWLDGRTTRQALRAAMPTNRFIMTPTAAAIHDLLHYAKSAPDAVTWTGGPGTGKTAALCEFTRRNRAVYKLVCEGSLNTIRALLTAVASLTGSHTKGSSFAISRGITSRLTGANALLIFDEAQHLTSEMIDQLRTYLDQAGCGIAFVGNSQVVGKIDGGRRSAEFAQLSSRVGIRMSRPKPLRGDVDALLDAWAVEGSDIRAELQKAAKRPGGLRVMQRCHRLAQMLASAESRAITLKDIQIALEKQAAAPAGEPA